MKARARPATVDFPAAALAVLSLGAAAIHFAVMPEHLKEWWLFGLFFAGLGWFQALWAVAYLLAPERRLAWLAIAVNLATVAVWVWSPTLGLPVGPDPGIPEAVGIPDSLASVLELSLVIWLVKARGRHLSATLDDEWLPILATLVFAGVVAGATSAAITLGGM